MLSRIAPIHLAIGDTLLLLILLIAQMPRSTPYTLFLGLAVAVSLVVLYLYRPGAPHYFVFARNGQAVDCREMLLRLTMLLLLAALAWLIYRNIVLT